MCPFDLARSLERARIRLGTGRPARTRGHRSDRGRSRLDPRVLALVAAEASGQERPRMKAMLCGIRERCAAQGLKAPSRATVYKLLTALPGSTTPAGDLPGHVQEALYNLTADTEVPGRQIAFYCFNSGDLRAISFAAGLPWLALYQALRLPGYRPKSRGLIEAVALTRRI